MEALNNRDASASSEVLKAVQMAIAATEKKDFKSALTLFNHVYGNPAFEPPVEGLSYYGLCVAIAEKQTKKGIELCREAITEQFYDSRHHANLVKLHLAKGNRKLACQAMEAALKNLPQDKSLLQFRSEMGYRTRKPVPFLPRNNAINNWLGVRRRGTGTRPGVENRFAGGVSALDLTNLRPFQMLLFGVLGFASVFSITFYILYQRAYG